MYIHYYYEYCYNVYTNSCINDKQQCMRNHIMVAILYMLICRAGPSCWRERERESATHIDRQIDIPVYSY